MNVSVIIPVFNSEKTILDTINSIKNQINIEFIPEIIVVDDGSYDKTLSILKSVEDIIVLSQNNFGPASARNKGVDVAHGDIIVFTDSDTLPQKDWLYNLTNAFLDSTIVAATGTYGIANKDVLLAELIQNEISYKHSKYGEFIKFGGTYNFAIRKDVFYQIGGFDESFKNASGEDTEFCYRLLQKGYLIRYIPQAIVKHYHPEKIINYLKTQFKHGYWRAKIYLSFPNRVQGDDYTGSNEIVETLLTGNFILLFLLWFIYRLSNLRKIFKILLFLDFFSICYTEFKIVSLMDNIPNKVFAGFVFGLRSFVRTLGFIWGLIAFWGYLI